MMLRHLLPLLLIGLATADDVLELVDTDFDGKLADIETALVMFYAPWYSFYIGIIVTGGYIDYHASMCLEFSHLSLLRCGHCKRLKPEFEKAASGLLANDPPVTLAKVDCTEGGKSTCGRCCYHPVVAAFFKHFSNCDHVPLLRFDVKGYPTLKIFRNGELSSDYNGPREAAGISKFMRLVTAS